MTAPDAIAGVKAAARAAALAARQAAHDASVGAARQAAGHALAAIAPERDIGTIAGYLPIRSEIDPQPAMLALDGLGFRVCVPVIEARGLPLRFRAWSADAALVPGPFGVPVPAAGEELEPDLLLVPLLAYDARCFRLGYGGGFYDRTLAALRARRDTRAFGLAYADQRVEAVPHEPTDAPLDAVITEQGVLWPA